MVWQPAEGGEAVSAAQWSLGEDDEAAPPAEDGAEPSGNGAAEIRLPAATDSSEDGRPSPAAPVPEEAPASAEGEKR
jgi:hypothetical protein